MESLEALRDRYPETVGFLASALEGERLHHAYLLVTTSRRAGTTVADALTLRLVCAHPTGAAHCGSCSGCQKVAAQTHPDVFYLAPNEKGVIPIDAVRSMTPRLALRASEAQTKVVRIGEADRMNIAAQNALLKTLEEPPGRTCFILTAARPRSLLLTVRSRCQRLGLAPDRGELMVQNLTEAGIDAPLAKVLAPLTSGDVGHAQTLLEQGAAEILEQLDRVLERPENTSLALRTASELGATKEHAGIATQLLEVRVRDALAEAHRAPGTTTQLKSTQRQHLVDTLQRLRRMENRNLNKTLALEALFLGLADKTDESQEPQR